MHMELVCTKENLYSGVQTVQRAVASHGPMPILSNLLLVANGDALEITATDLELGIKATIPAQVNISGSITLAAKQLSEIIGKLPNSDIKIAAEDTKAELQCLKSRFSLPGMNAVDYPELPKVDTEVSTANLDATRLLKGIKQTTFAAAKDDKSVISGVSFQVKEGVLEIAATDGYRLATKNYPVENAPEMTAIIPARALNELARMLGSQETVSLSMARNQILFDFGDRYLTSRLIDGQFPPYRNIIPQSFSLEALIDRSSFLSSVERVSIMASEREAKVIRLQFNPGQITMYANAADLGESQEQVDVDYEGEEITIAFNSHYLLDAIRAMEGETLKLQMNSSTSQTLLSSLDDPSYGYILMPIRG